MFLCSTHLFESPRVQRYQDQYRYVMIQRITGSLSNLQISEVKVYLTERGTRQTDRNCMLA